MHNMAQVDLESFFEYYEGLPHQAQGVELLEAAMPLELLDDSADWVVQYRNEPQSVTSFAPSDPYETLVSEHINYGEIALWSQARRFFNQQQCDVATEICEFLEKARAHFGGNSIVITSGHRPPAINAAVGGAVNSEHLYNGPDTGAIDWYIDNVSVYDLQEYCLTHWPYSTGKGASKGFVHSGIRTGRQRIVWNY